MVKQLLIRGDDLGYSEAVTLGMISAHRKGLVNSVALMVNMPYAKEAIKLAKQCPNLCLGLHVNVTNGYALAPKEMIPSLVDEHGIFLSSTIRRAQIKNNGLQRIAVTHFYYITDFNISFNFRFVSGRKS